MVALSESVTKIRVERPQAEKSWWRHIRFGNETSFSRKPCIADKKLLWNAIWKSWSLLQNPSWIIAWNAPLAAKSRWRHIRLACNKTSLSRKPCIPDQDLLWNAIGKSWSLFQNPSWKSREAPPGGGLTKTSCPVGNKTSLSRKPCIADKNYFGSISWSLGRLVIFIKKTANSNFKNS